MPRYPSVSTPPLTNGASERTLENTLDLLLEPMDPLFDVEDPTPLPKPSAVKKPTKRLTAKELLQLFKTWEASDEATERAREAMTQAIADFEACKARRSDASQAILEQAGRGPFEYPAGSGRVLIPWTAPGPRDKSRPHTYYMRDTAKKLQRVE